MLLVDYGLHVRTAAAEPFEAEAIPMEKPTLDSRPTVYQIVVDHNLASLKNSVIHSQNSGTAPADADGSSS